jgi:hypothetical protein
VAFKFAILSLLIKTRPQAITIPADEHAQRRRRAAAAAGTARGDSTHH